MWKQALVAASLVALAGGCEDRTTKTTTTSSGRVTGTGSDSTYRTSDTTTNRTVTPADPSITTPPSTVTTPPAGMAGADSDFLRKASSINMAEVEAGKLAQSQAQSADVKSFADMMVKDHNDANDKLRTAAGTSVSFPSDILPEHKAAADQFKSQKGAAFDQAFIAAMVDGHQQAINLFQQEASSGQNDALKSYAQSMLPSLKMHLDHAKEIQSKLGNPSMTTPPDQPPTPPSDTPSSTPSSPN